MIIKLNRIISCSSEHPNFPASNLLSSPPAGPWKCAKPGEMLASVIFELSEPSYIIGIDIGNYRSCVIIVAASKSSEPDNWIQMINHQFLTHDEAANSKFKDQVQLFTKKELNPEVLKEQFDRVKVTCMQSANLKELFGLSFITLRTEVVVDMRLDVFGRFKMKTEDLENTRLSFREKYLKLFPEKQKNFKEDLADKIKETGMNNFNKRQEDEDKKPKKRPLLEKLEAGKTDEVFGKKTNDESTSNNPPRTLFGDIIPTPVRKKNPASRKNSIDNNDKTNGKLKTQQNDDTENSRRAMNRLSTENKKTNENVNDKTCSVCKKCSSDEICKMCKRLPLLDVVKSPSPKRQKTDKNKNDRKVKKDFSKLMDDVTFSLSGYVNPQRDEIRRKALKMGAKYIADPNTTNNICTHLICAFKNTPKYQQLKGHAKIVSHIYIEECFDHKKRYPWRRYALSSSARKRFESEDEIEGSTSPVRPRDPYEQETDSNSDDTDY